jgi:hypothetical protein
MTWHTRVLVAGVAALALGVGTLVAGRSFAAGQAGDAQAKLLKIAAGIEKGEDVTKDVAALAKDTELDEVMHSFALRSKKGIGVGDPKDKITPDGIEALLINWARKVPPAKTFEKQAPAVAKAAYVAAAIADYAVLKAPEKKEGPKDPKDWVSWSKDQKAAALELAKALKAKDAKAVKDSASKLNSSCNNCHGVFRD